MGHRKVFIMKKAAFGEAYHGVPPTVDEELKRCGTRVTRMYSYSSPGLPNCRPVA